MEKNSSSYFYSYPVIWDVDSDGVLECSFSVWDYPNFANYNYEVYNTGITTSNLSEGEVPKAFSLKQNYPNPFNPATTIEFDTEKMQHVSLNIYDILGQKVSTILDRSLRAGKHKVNFNGSNLSSGSYFYQLKTEDGVNTKKMTIIK
ncbi:MAG: T9SS type A sorting domain-containing protein [Melioribacteraceae bacterium]|nr:T9SS type A sorting domain-containing protein [Melioribacteraceae bacterium]